MADGARLGLCLLCTRLVDKPGAGSLQPAAVKVRGVAQCVNFAGSGA
jgi:hypothetical protein